MLIRKIPKSHYQFMQISLFSKKGTFCIASVHTRSIFINIKVFSDSRFQWTDNETLLPQTLALKINRRGL